MHNTPLITTLVVGIVLAFVLGSIAQRLRLSPLVGYLIAGLVIGPYSPGYVADQAIAAELAELGVILLMFGVGLHFSLRELLDVKGVAIPGAIIQIVAATAMGIGLAHWIGWSIGTGLIFGLSLAVASTVVLLRALQQLRLLDTLRGRTAVGWLIVEDLVMVLALVLLPAVAPALGPDSQGASLDTAELLSIVGITVGKVIAFALLMLLVGRRVIPWALQWVAHQGSRELFRLAILAIALGVALGAAYVFGVSFALGAFVAGMVLAESDLSVQAAEESLPFRDAFAVLFFVSVGMLFDPSVILEQPVFVLLTIGIVIVGKSVIAYVIVRLAKKDHSTGLTIAVSLAQIGEFSFILIALGMQLELLPDLGRDLVLAAAIASICLNPVLFRLIPQAATEQVTVSASGRPIRSEKVGHTVLVGYGRVGSTIGAGLHDRGEPFIVIEDRDTPARAAVADGAELIVGNGADPEMLQAANIGAASRLVVAIPNSVQAGEAIRAAHAENPDLHIYARAHSDREVVYLHECGATESVLGEHEIARGMLKLLDGQPL